MLILSRKEGESIRVGDDIIVDVHRIVGGRVHLAISAPIDVKIMRQEVLDRIAQLQKQTTDDCV